MKLRKQETVVGSGVSSLRSHIWKLAEEKCRHLMIKPNLRVVSGNLLDEDITIDEKGGSAPQMTIEIGEDYRPAAHAKILEYSKECGIANPTLKVISDVVDHGLGHFTICPGIGKRGAEHIISGIKRGQDVSGVSMNISIIHKLAQLVSDIIVNVGLENKDLKGIWIWYADTMEKEGIATESEMRYRLQVLCRGDRQDMGFLDQYLTNTREREFAELFMNEMGLKFGDLTNNRAIVRKVENWSRIAAVYSMCAIYLLKSDNNAEVVGHKLKRLTFF
jgi:hypothetical protein